MKCCVTGNVIICYQVLYVEQVINGKFVSRVKQNKIAHRVVHRKKILTWSMKEMIKGLICLRIQANGEIIQT
jgi:hypothetical protein